MAPARQAPLALLLLAACGGGADQLVLMNRLPEAIGLEVRAPDEALRGGCDQDFATRFCADEYAIIGVLDFDGGETRAVTISDATGGDRCTNILWLRLVWLGAPEGTPEGPAQDPGALFELPARVEVEEGTGALHGVAFPSKTVRLDEVGSVDAQQAAPPATCATLGRAPRS
ncbi:MAG: hypothetical protein H6730_01810 [Deltaproteobacteria bacterium]|nr:hypothetical protein [Deltaproteobacteria bacterium]